jgi:hypothetical protein
MTGKSTLHCQNNYYDIFYRISNATVSNVTASTNFQLIFDIHDSKNGIMNIEIPRNILTESMPNSTDYVPYVEGHYLSNKDISNSTHLMRTLVLPDGNFKLEIDATGYMETMPARVDCSVMPEFGFLVGIIITISFISVIMISKKFTIK